MKFKTFSLSLTALQESGSALIYHQKLYQLYLDSTEFNEVYKIHQLEERTQQY